MHGGAYFRNFTVFFLKWPLPPPPPRQNTSCSLAREEQPERLPSYSITVKWSRFGHAEIYALVRQDCAPDSSLERRFPRIKSRYFPETKDCSSVLRGSQLILKGIAFFSTAVMGHVNKCLYLSRSCYHTAVSRSWPHHLRTEFQRFFRVSRRLEHFRCPFVSYFLFSSLVDSF